MRIILAALVAMGPTVALAQMPIAPPNCAPKDQMLAGLLEKFGETPGLIARSAKGLDVIWTANIGTGTWSLVMAGPDGRACLLESGTGFAIPRAQQVGEPT